jgi:4-hydroxy-3-methylbut-2-en-1-yl diphosphate reductase
VRSQRRAPSTVRCDATPPPSLDPDFDKKAFRHNLTRSENYNRKGFGHKKETLELMSQEYTSK